jgi:hypothetical protein
MNKKQILTHYEFQKYIALALIDEERWGPHSENWRKVLTKKGKGVAYSNEYQPMEKANKDKIQATRINEQTLDPITGKLRNRLCYGGQHNLRHIPVKCLQREPLCALHRFAFGRENTSGKLRAQCMWCNDCNVILCISCFEKFHIIKNPKQLKAEVIQATKIRDSAKRRKRS